MKRDLIIITLVLGFAVGGLSQVGESQPRPDGSAVRQISISSDGWNLMGDLRVPKSPRSLPVVILLNKAGGSRQAYEGLAEELASLEIASLRLDLRGHGESTNKGKFGPPFDAPMLKLIEGSDQDVSAAVAYLKKLKEIDANRIGIVGASYTGEQMAISARKSGYAKAYVALSPGSFSEESIKAIDASSAAWLFVRSAHERHLKGLHESIRKVSKTAELYEVGGDKHATDLLDSLPKLVGMIAVWFKYKL